jgi:murein L,D-transpeptidase YcbB/YkuD
MISGISLWRSLILAAAIFASSFASGLAQERQGRERTAEALHAALVERHTSIAEGASDPLFDFYRSRNFAPAWTGSNDDDGATAAVLLVLSHADAQGLLVQDYSNTANKWNAVPEPGPESAAFEISLTADLMRYAADVRLGKVDPARVYHDVELPARTFEFVAALNKALRAGRIDSFLADLPPPQPEYRGLVQALESYRAQQSRGGWTKIPAGSDVALDGSNPRSLALIKRLSQEDSSLAAGQSLEDVHNGLMRFQTRNNIRADGRAGPQTLTALNVPIGVRISQIVANMERWRWLQRKFEDSYILVNVPDQTAQFISNGSIVMETRAIVGRPASRTPITRMMGTSLVLNPPWHVPEDIAQEQLLPKLRQNPNYLASRNMVLVDGPPDDPQGRKIPWRSVTAMPYLVDQNPGPDSAMGTMMLDAPNNFGVYLHDTPGKSLFEAPTREASNGCIRVENMLQLSALIMGGDGDSAIEQLRADIATGETQRVPLGRDVPIYLLYQTAIAYQDGAVGFRSDLYGRDKPLIAALAAAR